MSKSPSLELDPKYHW